MATLQNAHACSRWWGMRYMNTHEAFEHALRCGFKNIEVDLSRTKDGRFVCGHDYWKIREMPEVEWLSIRLHGFWPILSGRTMSLSDLVDKMRRNADVRIMIDCHFSFRECDRCRWDKKYKNCGNQYLREFATEILKFNILDRCVIEVYSTEHLEMLLELGIENVQLWIDMNDPCLKEFERIEDYCGYLEKKHVKYVSVPGDWLRANPKYIRQFHNLGIVVYSSKWVTNRDWKLANELGVDYVTIDSPFPNSRLVELVISACKFFPSIKDVLRSCVKKFPGAYWCYKKILSRGGGGERKKKVKCLWKYNFN